MKEKDVDDYHPLFDDYSPYAPQEREEEDITIDVFHPGDMVCFSKKNRVTALSLDDPSKVHPWKLPRKGVTFSDGDTGIVVESTTFFDPISSEDRTYYKIATSKGVGWIFPVFLKKIEGGTMNDKTTC